ncbi:MAG: GDSL-type esterase/lipase family protein [Puniceicoccaceae bacterium]
MGLFIAFSNGLIAAEVILMGDSWGVRVGSFIEDELNANGLSAYSLLNTSVGGSRADQWNDGLILDVAQLLADNPDERLVHLIIGGNDLLASWPDLDAIPAVVNDVIELLVKISGATEAPILLSSYDYLPGPVFGADIATQNALLAEYLEQLATALANHAFLGSRVTLINSLGLMQVAFGVPQASLPAGDPALPDPALPGPAVAFSDAIHLSNSGHSVYAEFLFDEFYAPTLLWAGIPIANVTRDVDTGGFLGWLNVSQGDWVWSYSLNAYLYCPEENISEAGAWVYIFD